MSTLTNPVQSTLLSGRRVAQSSPSKASRTSSLNAWTSASLPLAARHSIDFFPFLGSFRLVYFGSRKETILFGIICMISTGKDSLAMTEFLPRDINIDPRLTRKTIVVTSGL